MDERSCADATSDIKVILRDQGPFIRRTLWCFGVRRRDVPDVAQEVFLGVAHALPGFDPTCCATPRDALRVWLLGICRRQAASHHRRTARRAEVLEPVEVLDEQEGTSPLADAGVIEAERMSLLFELLAALDPDRRKVIVAYELEETPMREIAQSLAIPVNTAWTRLRRARADLIAKAHKPRPPRPTHAVPRREAA